MLGRDKNRSTIKEKTKIKETINVPASEVRQEIRHGTSLLGGTSTNQYTNAQQFVNQQGYTGYTPDPYLSRLSGEQQFATNVDSKIERRIEQNITSNIGQGYGTTIPVQTNNSGFGTSIPVGTNVMQRNRVSSSSSSSSEERNKMRGTGGNLVTSNVETLRLTQPYPQNTYSSELPFQQGNIQTGYGTTEVGYQNPNMYVGNAIESSIYRSSIERKGPILGKNLYGETGFASSGYSIQQPFPGQNIYIEEDPNKISERTKEKFERSVI